MHYQLYLIPLNVQLPYNELPKFINSVLICSLFPSIVDEQERLNYKREFDRDHQEYKSLQVELESINQDLADLDRELGRQPEGSPQFLVSVAVSSSSLK